MPKRYQINVFVTGSLNDQFPVNTYVTDSAETASVCVAELLTNPNSGMSRVEIIDTTKKMPLHTMAPWDLDRN